jgi:hypothetical protein
MASLTEVTWMIRKGFVYGSIGSVVALLLGIAVWYGVKTVTTKPSVPTPTPGLAFGALPQITFPQSKPRPNEYELLLIEGAPPPSQYAAVYFVPKKAPTLFSRKNAADLATQFGFTQDPVITDTTQYDYIDIDTKNKLTIDIPYKYFTYQMGSVEPTKFLAQVPEDEGTLKAAAEAYIRAVNLWNDDLKNIKVKYVVWTGSGFTPEELNNKTSFARVDFFNPSANDIPIVTAEPSAGNVFIVFGFTAPNQRVMLASKYKYYAPDFNNSSTYPTISGDTAWAELKAGGGYIAQPLKAGTKAVIRRIYMGYYQPDAYQDYLQPVWVFEGDQNFVGMVHALDPTYLGVQ